jgi:HSP20 family molecular chaperone IbpA
MTQSKHQISKFNRELFNNREEFLTPFDSLFDNIISKAYPTFSQEFGVEFFGNNSYPKVDVIDHEDKITIEAEIPGLGKEDVSVDLEEIWRPFLCIFQYGVW